MPLDPNLRRYLPSLRDEDFKETSPEDLRYNCFAYALGENDRRWDPTIGYWPNGVTREVTTDAFVAAFATKGYERCDTFDVEPTYEKIALYIDASGEPSHAARQLPNGRWTSKLGYDIDVDHANLHCLAGSGQDQYGEPAICFRRLSSTRQ